MELLKLFPAKTSLSGAIHIPGSKSDTNRALVLAALASGTSELKAVSLSNDSNVLLQGLQQLGAKFEIKNGTVHVTGTGGCLAPFEGEINVGPAGTSMRFLTSVAALAGGGKITLSGSERMHQRPIGALVEAWDLLGVQIEYLGTPGCPPLRVTGQNPQELASKTSIPGDVSSQFMSSLLLVSPLLPNGLELHVQGEQISKSYIDMTFSVMKAFGIQIENDGYQCYRVAPGQSLQARSYTVEGDASGGSYFWGLAAVTGGTIRVHNASSESCQGDVRFPQLLAQMGCNVTSGSENGLGWIEVSGTQHLQGVTVDMEQMPDTAMTLAVVAACAEGQTHITGLQTLRHKETDRLAAIQAELAKVGIRSDITNDSITVYGAKEKLRGARIETYEDHRMAMSFSLLGTICEGIEIEDPGVVAKSFPNYWEAWHSLGFLTELS